MVYWFFVNACMYFDLSIYSHVYHARVPPLRRQVQLLLCDCSRWWNKEAQKVTRRGQGVHGRKGPQKSDLRDKCSLPKKEREGVGFLRVSRKPAWRQQLRAATAISALPWLSCQPSLHPSLCTSPGHSEMLARPHSLLSPGMLLLLRGPWQMSVGAVVLGLRSLLSVNLEQLLFLSSHSTCSSSPYRPTHHEVAAPRISVRPERDFLSSGGSWTST